MSSKRPFIGRLLAALLLVLAVGPGWAQRPGPEDDVHAQAALGTSFTYQGRLIRDGEPADGPYDFRFRLYRATKGGAQLGSAVTRGDVDVSEGLFTVRLDFGDVFDGTALWMEVAVRPGGSSDAYTPLAPCQALTAAPHALYASHAPWGGPSGVPVSLSDGDDDTTYSAGVGLTLSGGAFSVDFDGSGSASTVARPYAQQNRIPVEEEMPANEKGTHLYPQGYGQPEEMGLDYQRNAHLLQQPADPPSDRRPTESGESAKREEHGKATSLSRLAGPGAAHTHLDCRAGWRWLRSELVDGGRRGAHVQRERERGLRTGRHDRSAGRRRDERQQRDLHPQRWILGRRGSRGVRDLPAADTAQFVRCEGDRGGVSWPSTSGGWSGGLC